MRCWVVSADWVDLAAAAKGRPRTKVRRTGRSCSTQRDPIVSTVQPSNVQRPMIIRLGLPAFAYLHMPRSADSKLITGRGGGYAQAARSRSQLSGSSRRGPRPPGHRASAQPRWRAGPDRAGTRARACEVEPVGIPAGSDSGLGADLPVRVELERETQQLEPAVVEEEVAVAVQLARELGGTCPWPGSRWSFSRLVSCSNPKAKTICGSAPVSAARSRPVVATASQCASPCSHESRRHASARTRSTSTTRRYEIGPAPCLALSGRPGAPRSPPMRRSVGRPSKPVRPRQRAAPSRRETTAKLRRRTYWTSAVGAARDALRRRRSSRRPSGLLRTCRRIPSGSRAAPARARRLFHRDDVPDAGRVGAVDAPDESLAVRERDHARYGACHGTFIPRRAVFLTRCYAQAQRRRRSRRR